MMQNLPDFSYQEGERMLFETQTHFQSLQRDESVVINSHTPTPCGCSLYLQYHLRNRSLAWHVNQGKQLFHSQTSAQCMSNRKYSQIIASSAVLDRVDASAKPQRKEFVSLKPPICRSIQQNVRFSLKLLHETLCPLLEQ